MKFSLRVNGTRAGETARPVARPSVALGAMVIETPVVEGDVEPTPEPDPSAPSSRSARLRLRVNRAGLR